METYVVPDWTVTAAALFPHFSIGCVDPPPARIDPGSLISSKRTQSLQTTHARLTRTREASAVTLREARSRCISVWSQQLFDAFCFRCHLCRKESEDVFQKSFRQSPGLRSRSGRKNQSLDGGGCNGIVGSNSLTPALVNISNATS